VNDFQKRIQSVTGPNAKGEYKVVVMQGNDIVSHYVTKTPPPNWLYKNNDVDEGWKHIAGAAALAGATALGGYAAGSRDSGNGVSNTKGIDQFNKPTAAHVQPLRTRADLDAYNKTRPPGESKLLNLPSDFEESQVNEKEEEIAHGNTPELGQDETSMFIRQLRMRNPQAKSDLAALAADYRQNVNHDGQEITRLDHENDREDADIDRLDVENDHEQDDIARLKQLIQQLKQR
jgi:hypothetical protein